MHRIYQRSISQVLICSIGLVMAVGFLDVITGPEIHVFVFYMLPISLMTVRIGVRAGAGIALLSAITWYGANAWVGRSPSHPFIPIWNTTIALGLFLLTAIVTQRQVALQRALWRQLEREEVLARLDPLTEVGNRRHFETMALQEVERAQRYAHPFTVLYLDLDDFKLVNDRLGHAVGDRLLRLIAHTLQHELRSSDTVARLGGDEFVVLLSETDARAADEVLARLRRQLSEQCIQAGWPVSVSVGAATYLTPPASVDEMLQCVDQLMYDVKRRHKGLLQHAIIGSDIPNWSEVGV